MNETDLYRQKPKCSVAVLELTAIFLIPSLLFFGEHKNSSPISTTLKFTLNSETISRLKAKGTS